LIYFCFDQHTKVYQTILIKQDTGTCFNVPFLQQQQITTNNNNNNNNSNKNSQ